MTGRCAMPDVSVTVTLTAQELKWLRMTIAKATDAKIVEWSEGLSWIARLDNVKRDALDRYNGQLVLGVME